MAPPFAVPRDSWTVTLISGPKAAASDVRNFSTSCDSPASRIAASFPRVEGHLSHDDVLLRRKGLDIFIRDAERPESRPQFLLLPPGELDLPRICAVSWTTTFAPGRLPKTPSGSAPDRRDLFPWAHFATSREARRRRSATAAATAAMRTLRCPRTSSDSASAEVGGKPAESLRKGKYPGRSVRKQRDVFRIRRAEMDCAGQLPGERGGRISQQCYRNSGIRRRIALQELPPFLRQSDGVRCHGGGELARPADGPTLRAKDDDIGEGRQDEPLRKSVRGKECGEDRHVVGDDAVHPETGGGENSDGLFHSIPAGGHGEELSWLPRRGGQEVGQDRLILQRKAPLELGDVDLLGALEVIHRELDLPQVRPGCRQRQHDGREVFPSRPLAYLFRKIPDVVRPSERLPAETSQEKRRREAKGPFHNSAGRDGSALWRREVFIPLP